MGAGVSLSLSRDGVHGKSICPSIFSLISDPFPREHGFYVGSVPLSRDRVFLCERNFSGEGVSLSLSRNGSPRNGECLLQHRGIVITGTAPPTKGAISAGSKDVHAGSIDIKSYVTVAVSGSAAVDVVSSGVVSGLADCLFTVADSITGAVDSDPLVSAPLCSGLSRSEEVVQFRYGGNILLNRKSSVGSSGLLMTRSEHGSPEKGVQVTPEIQTIGKASFYGFDPLIRSARPCSDDFDASVKFNSADGGKEDSVNKCAGLSGVLANQTACCPSLGDLILDGQSIGCGHFPLSNFGSLILPLFRADLVFGALPDLLSDPGRIIVPVFENLKLWVPRMDILSVRTISPTTESLKVFSDGTQFGYPKQLEGSKGNRLLGFLGCVKSTTTDTAGRTAIRRNRLMFFLERSSDLVWYWGPNPAEDLVLIWVHGLLKNDTLRTEVRAGLGCLTQELYLSTGRTMGLWFFPDGNFPADICTLVFTRNYSGSMVYPLCFGSCSGSGQLIVFK